MPPDEIRLSPVGEVVVAEGAAGGPAAPGVRPEGSVIRVYPEYLAGLHRLTEHSHAWILCWFHEADRSPLRITPGRAREAGSFGVFGLRTPARPNPIGLTAVRLLGLEGDLLRVEGLDARAGTPVLDIKPYVSGDIIFSARTPYVRAADPDLRRRGLRRQTLAHHGEECPWVEVGVAMALTADAEFGQLQAPDLTLTVTGPACLADVLQGLTRARLANPPRFRHTGEAGEAAVTWQKGDRRLRITLRPGRGPDEAGVRDDRELLHLEWL